MAEGLAAAQAIKPGHGNVTVGAAASSAQQFVGAQLGYQQHFVTAPGLDLSAFANASAGLRGGLPDVGAVAGIRLEW